MDENIHFEGSRNRWIDENSSLEGSRRRLIGKSNVLEVCRIAGSRKLSSWGAGWPHRALFDANIGQRSWSKSVFLPGVGKSTALGDVGLPKL